MALFAVNCVGVYLRIYAVTSMTVQCFTVRVRLLLSGKVPACLSTCPVPACLSTCPVPACLSTCPVPACLSACPVPACLSTCPVPACLSTCPVPACLSTCLVPAFHSNYEFAIRLSYYPTSTLSLCLYL